MPDFNEPLQAPEEQTLNELLVDRIAPIEQQQAPPPLPIPQLPQAEQQQAPSPTAGDTLNMFYRPSANNSLSAFGAGVAQTNPLHGTGAALAAGLGAAAQVIQQQGRQRRQLLNQRVVARANQNYQTSEREAAEEHAVGMQGRANQAAIEAAKIKAVADRRLQSEQRLETQRLDAVKRISDRTEVTEGMKKHLQVLRDSEPLLDALYGDEGSTYIRNLGNKPFNAVHQALYTYLEPFFPEGQELMSAINTLQLSTAGAIAVSEAGGGPVTESDQALALQRAPGVGTSANRYGELQGAFLNDSRYAVDQLNAIQRIGDAHSMGLLTWKEADQQQRAVLAKIHKYAFKKGEGRTEYERSRDFTGNTYYIPGFIDRTGDEVVKEVSDRQYILDAVMHGDLKDGDIVAFKHPKSKEEEFTRFWFEEFGITPKMQVDLQRKKSAIDARREAEDSQVRAEKAKEAAEMLEKMVEPF